MAKLMAAAAAELAAAAMTGLGVRAFNDPRNALQCVYEDL